MHSNFFIRAYSDGLAKRKQNSRLIPKIQLRTTKATTDPDLERYHLSLRNGPANHPLYHYASFPFNI